MALEFSSRGWNVAGGARSAEALEELSKQIKTESFVLAAGCDGTTHCGILCPGG